MNLFNFSQWSNPSDFERNELVFEKRNKAYGAYAIRSNYNQTLLRALLCSVFFVFLLFMIPKICQLFAKEPIPMVDYGPIIFVIPPEEIAIKDKKKNKVIKNNVKTKAAVILKLSDTLLYIDSSIEKEKISVGLVNNPNGTDSLELEIYDGSADSGNKMITKEVVKGHNEVRKIASIMPRYVGGNEALFAYLRENLQFPEDAQREGISAKLNVNFVVEKDGSISNIKILSCTEKGFGFEKEAIRVISSMPRWKPGIQDGHPVRVFFNIPISFRLR